MPKQDKKPTYEELLDCVHNLMGVFDTPMARKLITSDFVEEARKIGRDIMERSKRKTWSTGA